MTQASIAELKRRADRAWSDKSAWLGILTDAFEYALPQRNIYENYSPGSPKTDRIFDSTAVFATQRFANRLLWEMTPPDQQWFTLKAGPTVQEESRNAIDQQLESFTAVLLATFDAAGFYPAAHESYMELAAGTGAILAQPGDSMDEPIIFVAVPDAQLAYEAGPHGTIDGIFRKRDMKVSHIERTWPDANIPDDWLQPGKGEDPEKELQEITYFDPKSRQWRYEVIHKLDDDEARLVERVERTNPWIILRWMKVAGETQGRGPLLAALPDIKTVNKIVEMTLKNAALALAGMYTVADDGVVNPDTITITEAGFIPVASNGGPTGPSIMPLQTGRNFDLAQFLLEEMRMNIRKMLFDNQLPPDAGPVRSATEIVQRMKELAQDIGSAFGRLQREMIQPLISRTIDILERKGILPTQGLKVDNLAIKIQVTSPLAQQASLRDVQATVQFAEIANSIAGPQAFLLAYKVEDGLPDMAALMGVPAKHIRDEAERDEMQKQVAAIMASQQAGAIPMGGAANDQGIPVGAAA